MLWSISIISDGKLSDKNKDLIAELVVDCESHQIAGQESTIHDILEGDNFSEVIIEGNRWTVKDVEDVLKDNLNDVSVISRLISKKASLVKIKKGGI